MNEVFEAEDAISLYVQTQRSLVTALFQKYGIPEDDLITNIPRDGIIDIDGYVWSFEKHGLGVLFRNPSSGQVVDVHRYLDTSNCFDPWRLVQYFESCKVGRLNVGSSVFDSQNEESVSRMLDKLCALKRVTRAENGTFKLA